MLAWIVQTRRRKPACSPGSDRDAEGICYPAGSSSPRDDIGALACLWPGPVIGLVILVMLLFAVYGRHLVDSPTIDGTSLGK